MYSKVVTEPYIHTCSYNNFLSLLIGCTYFLIGIEIKTIQCELHLRLLDLTNNFLNGSKVLGFILFNLLFIQ